MITEEEKKFLRYWEQNRDNENLPMVKLTRGFPKALMFSLPIILLVLVVRLFFPQWYTTISQTSPGMFLTAIIAVLCIVVFYSYFSMQFKWEADEQFYQELKAKEKKEQVKEVDSSST